MNKDNVIIQQFNSLEEAYLFGLGQAIANVTANKVEDTYQRSHANETIKIIHERAMQVFTKPAQKTINISKESE